MPSGDDEKRPLVSEVSRHVHWQLGGDLIIEQVVQVATSSADEAEKEVRRQLTEAATYFDGPQAVDAFNKTFADYVNVTVEVVPVTPTRDTLLASLGLVDVLVDTIMHDPETGKEWTVPMHRFFPNSVRSDMMIHQSTGGMKIVEPPKGIKLGEPYRCP